MSSLASLIPSGRSTKMKIKKLALSLLLVLFILPVGTGVGFSGQRYSSLQLPLRISGLPVPRTFSTAQLGCGGEVVPVINEGYEQRVVELVNEARAGQGLPPLKRNPALDQAARYHAADLGEDNYFDHDTFDRVAGELVEVCDTWSRISNYYTGASGENIAAGYATPEDVVQGWMDSEGHRANMLSDHSTEIGIGYFEGAGDYNQYWVQDFGAPGDVYPLVINGEDASTDTPVVSLYVYGAWQTMRLRNDGGDWTPWRGFTSTLDWTLDGAAGEKTVFVELRNGEKVVSTSDTIYLTEDASLPVLDDLPDAVQFIFSIPNQQIIPAYHQLTPGRANGRGELDWQVQNNGNFFTATPTHGKTSEPLTIMPTSFDLGIPGTYEGTLTITVYDAAGVVGTPHTITVTLEVVNTEIFQNFLPGIQN
jgi:uncharacterized protein YkwD